MSAILYDAVTGLMCIACIAVWWALFAVVAA